MNKPIVCYHLLVRRWMRLTGLLFVLCLLSFNANAQQLRLEYWFDADPGQGKAAVWQANPDADGNLVVEVPTDGLTTGNHLLGMRAFIRTDATVFYGPTLLQTILVPQQNDKAKVFRIEYFWDEDPGRGSGTPIAITPGKELNLDNIEIPTDGLSAGIHALGIRAFGNAGWGPTIRQDVLIPHKGDEAKVSRIEYFWDNDPGRGKGNPIAMTAGKELNLDDIEIPTDGLSAGSHALGLRAYGNAGWGPTILQDVLIPHKDSEAKVSRVEYFWDNDPGRGKGTPIVVTPDKELDLNNLEISTDGLSTGLHALGLRAYGNAGWSPTITSEVIVTPDPAAMVITNAEYFWNEDPGFGQGVPINITPGDMVRIEDFGIPSFTVHGDATLFIRYRSPMGWSPTMAYVVMVDAEGHYTLDASTVTSIEGRNYQSVAEALDDFYDRGIGDDVTLEVVTKNTDYVLDATTNERISQLGHIASQMTNSSIPRHQKTIAFAGSEGSGNTLTVTTTAEGMATVVGFFAQTSQENVALTINGTAYDFSPASLRFDETCSGAETALVGLSAISSQLKASWKAQPHNGTTLSGYQASGTGDLPAMTIRNTGTKMDSIAYQITLSDVDDVPLYSYTYYIYVHALTAQQSFTSLSPATGSSLDPGKVKLSWNAINDAVGGYRLEISDLSGSVRTIETDKTSYEVAVESGHQYTWKVTAIGYCDELTSTAMTFEGRLLPDMVVESITLPEAAEAGNTINVVATVKNQGTGATTEKEWTDRLYYVIDSEDFGQAVMASEQKHTGNIGPDESYTVSFTLKVPYVEAGKLRVFVETDVMAKVMETAEDNNRLLSSAATLKPFYMNTSDLETLRQLYTDFGGSAWNGSVWNIASELIAEGNWSGVTFNQEGRVMTINLQGRGLTGSLSEASAPAFPALTSLNLSHNSLTGDPVLFVTAEALPQLTKLNLSYNHIGQMSGPLPLTVTDVSLGSQDIDGSVTLSDMFAHIDQLESLLPKPMTYQPSQHAFAFSGYFELTNSRESRNQSWRMNTNDGYLQQVANTTVIYEEPNGREVKMRVHNGNVWNDMRLKIDFMPGDVNLDMLRNVTDLQHLINFIVNDTHPRVFFNFNAGDLEDDEQINVLDLVDLINLLLADTPATSRTRHSQFTRHSSDRPADAIMEVRGGELILTTNKPVAALDIVMSHVDESEIGWLLTDGGWQLSQRTVGNRNHVLIYSMTGLEIPAGETVLARIDQESANVDGVMLADAEAHEVNVQVKGGTTSVNGVVNSASTESVYRVDGIKRDAVPHRRGLYIINKKKRVVK